MGYKEGGREKVGEAIWRIHRDYVHDLINLQRLINEEQVKINNGTGENKEKLRKL